MTDKELKELLGALHNQKQAKKKNISATFVQQGSLGLKFTRTMRADGSDEIRVIGINPNTQAEQQPQLRAGLVLATVGGNSVLDQTYAQVIAELRKGVRPLTLAFNPPPSAEEAKEKLSQYIAKHGPSNIPESLVQATKIAEQKSKFSSANAVAGPGATSTRTAGQRVRRGSMFRGAKAIADMGQKGMAMAEKHATTIKQQSQDAIKQLGETAATIGSSLSVRIGQIGHSGVCCSPIFRCADQYIGWQDTGPAGLTATVRPPVSPRAAKVEDRSKNSTKTLGGGYVQATFASHGPLGIVWRANPGAAPDVKAIRDGSAASELPTICVGMVIHDVAGAAVESMEYEQVCITIWLCVVI
jgi:hypothetical protein